MHCIFFRYIIFRIFLVWKGLYVIKWPLGRNERDATLEILRSSETELPILKTKLPILGRQFQNKRTVRSEEHQPQDYCEYLISLTSFLVQIALWQDQTVFSRAHALSVGPCRA